jgi:hypothetical protein
MAHATLRIAFIVSWQMLQVRDGVLSVGDTVTES